MEVDTAFSAIELLEAVLEIEKRLGRNRSEKWGSRTIDIDILYFNNEIIHEERLTIPHPLLEMRRFALVPLVEICPAYVHPILMKNNRELSEHCPDKLLVELLAISSTPQL